MESEAKDFEKGMREFGGAVFAITYARLWYSTPPMNEPTTEGQFTGTKLVLAISQRGYVTPQGFDMPRTGSAVITRNLPGEVLDGTGQPFRTHLTISEEFTDDASEHFPRAVTIVDAWHPDPFDRVASALIAGGTESLPRARLHIAFKNREDADEFYLVESTAILFDLGDEDPWL